MQDDPDSVDRLIDDVARGMTAARPVDGIEGLARRVSVRLRDADPRAPRSWPRGWLLAPAAAVVLLAGFVVHNVNVRLKPDATGITTVTKERTTMAVVKPDTAPVARLNVEPLATPPLEVSALEVSPLPAVAPIEIAAIVFDRIEIAPMP